MSLELLIDKLLKNQSEAQIKPYSSIKLYLTKSCFTSGPIQYRRVWVEVLKFFSPEEILSRISLTCKTFYELSWDDYLWGDFFREKYSDDPLLSSIWRKKYIECFHYACFGCGSLIFGKEFTLHPNIGKIVCELCLENNPNVYFMTPYKISSVWRLNGLELKQLVNRSASESELKETEEMNSFKGALAYEIEIKINKERKRLKNHVVARLKNAGVTEEILRDIRLIDTERMDNLEFSKNSENGVEVVVNRPQIYSQAFNLIFSFIRNKFMMHYIPEEVVKFYQTIITKELS